MWCTSGEDDKENQNVGNQNHMALINSVLMGIYGFWASIFIIPSEVIKEVEKLCRNFLWGADKTYRKVPYVAWGRLCGTKKFGGLSIKNVVVWNKACIGKLIWALAEGNDSLWVKWVHEMYI